MRSPLRPSVRAAAASAIAALATVALPRPAPAQAWPDATRLEAALGRKALRIEDERVLHFYGWRREHEVTWQARPVEVFEGISFRTSFQRSGDECLVCGEWLVFADETLPVAAALAANGLRVASVVPRFPGAAPQPFHLRFLGEGGERELGAAVAAGMAAVATARTAAASPAAPPATLPVGESNEPSAIHERPLEDVFGCKAEVKDGVALFRFAGPRGLAGQPAGARLGIARTVAFAGTDEAARVRLDWAVDRRDLARVLGALAPLGVALESLVPAAPAFDDELVQVALLGAGGALELAHATKDVLQLDAPEDALVAEASFAPPPLPEVLGVAGGALGAGWRSDATHPDGPRRAEWAVAGGGEDDAPRAAMTAAGDWSSRTFNLLWNDGIRFGDGRLVVRMRADRGRVDQGGGLIWRARDANNYYVTRFNPLEQDFRVYRVKDGVREQLQALGELPYRSDAWFTIEVAQRGDDITCTLNGRETLRVQDTTFRDAGGIGLWSKADSQCSVQGLWLDRTDAAR